MWVIVININIVIIILRVLVVLLICWVRCGKFIFFYIGNLIHCFLVPVFFFWFYADYLSFLFSLENKYCFYTIFIFSDVVWWVVKQFSMPNSLLHSWSSGLGGRYADACCWLTNFLSRPIICVKIIVLIQGACFRCLCSYSHLILTKLPI